VPIVFNVDIHFILRSLREGSCPSGGSVTQYAQLWVRKATMLENEEPPNQLGKLVPPCQKRLSFFKFVDGCSISRTYFSLSESLVPDFVFFPIKFFLANSFYNLKHIKFSCVKMNMHARPVAILCSCCCFQTPFLLT
jgi:hypothetical protein